jgi:hypothetical protein
MRHFFGFTHEPFSSDIKVDDLYHTAALEGMKERFHYPSTWVPYPSSPGTWVRASRRP